MLTSKLAKKIVDRKESVGKMGKTKDSSAAYGKGYESGYNGEPENNPYYKKTPDADDWAQGYIRGKNVKETEGKHNSQKMGFTPEKKVKDEDSKLNWHCDKCDKNFLATNKYPNCPFCSSSNVKKNEKTKDEKEIVYVEKDDYGDWAIWGENSGNAIDSYSTRQEAIQVANRMNNENGYGPAKVYDSKTKAKDTDVITYNGFTIWLNKGWGQYNIYKGNSTEEKDYVANQRSLSDAKELIDTELSKGINLANSNKTINLKIPRSKDSTKDIAGQVVNQIGSYKIVQGVGPDGDSWFVVSSDNQIKRFTNREQAENYVSMNKNTKDKKPNRHIRFRIKGDRVGVRIKKVKDGANYKGYEIITYGPDKKKLEAKKKTGENNYSIISSEKGLADLKQKIDYEEEYSKTHDVRIKKVKDDIVWEKSLEQLKLDLKEAEKNKEWVKADDIKHKIINITSGPGFRDSKDSFKAKFRKSKDATVKEYYHVEEYSPTDFYVENAEGGESKGPFKNRREAEIVCKQLNEIKSRAYDIKDVEQSEEDKPFEAYGVKGSKSTPWRKTFKNQKEFEAWLDKNEGDVEVQGTRTLDARIKDAEQITSYKGHEIKTNGDAYKIYKDGQFIVVAETLEEAKSIIDDYSKDSKAKDALQDEQKVRVTLGEYKGKTGTIKILFTNARQAVVKFDTGGEAALHLEELEIVNKDSFTGMIKRKIYGSTPKQSMPSKDAAQGPVCPSCGSRNTKSDTNITGNRKCTACNTTYDPERSPRRDPLDRRTGRDTKDDNDGTLKGKIIEFFNQNPYPPDNAVHAFATREGIAPDEVENAIYSLLSDFLEGMGVSRNPDNSWKPNIGVGKDSKMKDEAVNKNSSMYERGKQDAITLGYIPDFKDKQEEIDWSAGYKEQKAKSTKDSKLTPSEQSRYLLLYRKMEAKKLTPEEVKEFEVFEARLSKSSKDSINPDIAVMYKQKLQDAIQSGNKEEQNYWINEIFNHLMSEKGFSVDKRK